MQALEMQDTEVVCPFCGESIDVLIDTSILEQDYIEDCQVCCRPIHFSVHCDEQTVQSVIVKRD